MLKTQVNKDRVQVNVKDKPRSTKTGYRLM